MCVLSLSNINTLSEVECIRDQIGQLGYWNVSWLLLIINNVDFQISLFDYLTLEAWPCNSIAGLLAHVD